jgi:signal transduction histidine kinase
MILNQSVLAQQLKHEGVIKDDFINTAAHELRTPTQAIGGYSELNDELFNNYLRNKKNMTVEELSRIMTKLHEHHESISRNASRLNILTNNLLDVARFESDINGDIILQKEKVDLVKEINEIVEGQFNQKTKDKGIMLNFINNSIDEHCWIYADELRLHQILINLIDNGIKFSKRNDVINIIIRDNDDFDIHLNQTEIDRTKDKDITFSNRAEKKEEIRETAEKQVYVGICDTGKGISPRIMSKLFEKFATDSDFGTGLGLYISKKLVEAHGGRIWAFNNNDGIGCTFVFSLPR